MEYELRETGLAPSTVVGMYPNRIVPVPLVIRATLLACSLPLFIGARSAPDPADRGLPAHPFRLSVADVGVTASTLEVRIRFFWDDLQFAVMESTSDMAFELAQDDEVDKTVEQYINDMLVFEAGGAPVQGVLVERGVEEAPRLDEVMWWYRLEYRLPASVERIHIRNRLLFNMFEDQRNLVNLKTRSGRERTYYFTWDEDGISVPVG